MKDHRIRSFIFMLLTLGLILYQGSSFSQTKTPKRVAILPFTMNADRDLSFLRDGLVDMMGSRLAWKGEVDIIQKGLVKDAMARFDGPMTKETALDIGKALKADYVILGSLTMFGDSVSMDARPANGHEQWLDPACYNPGRRLWILPVVKTQICG